MTGRRSFRGVTRWLARRALVSLVHAAVRVIKNLRGHRAEGGRARVCIESGLVGFTLIDIQEVERSAIEHFGRDAVSRSVVTDRNRYLSNARQALADNLPSMYWVDPRSGSQKCLRGPLQSVGLALLLAWNGVIPVVWLTDLPHRRWRIQAEILSAGSGIGFILENPLTASVTLAHRNFFGPTPMPISAETLDWLAGLSAEPSISQPTAVFVGSLYEPRTTFIRMVQQSLAQRGYQLDVRARELGGERTSDQEYWRLLSSAHVVFTTAAQVGAVRGVDSTDSPHLVYRYTEALAAGTALVAPHVPGSEHVLEPGTHYAAYRNEAEAVELIIELLEDEERRIAMAVAGRARIEEIQRSDSVWILAGQLAER